MVQQLFGDVEKLKAEIKRLRGLVDSFSIGGRIIPHNTGVISNQANNAQSVIQNFINNSGGPLSDGDVVVLDVTGARRITTTVTPQDITVLGVVRDFLSIGPFANAAETPVLLIGNMGLVKVNGAVAAGDYLVTTNSAARAKSVGVDETQAGIFAVAESVNASGNGTVTASIFPVNFGGGSGTPHDLLDGVQNQDTLAGSVADGDQIQGNSTPKWSRVPISIPGAAHLWNFWGLTTGQLRASWNALFDTTAPSTQAFGDAAVVGTADTAAHRDHKHAMPAQPAAYATVEDEGTPLTQRSTINFVGAGVSAADSGGITTVTISGGTGGAGSISAARTYISFGVNESGQSYTP